MVTMPAGSANRAMHATVVAAPCGAAGEAAPRPYGGRGAPRIRVGRCDRYRPWVGATRHGPAITTVTGVRIRIMAGWAPVRPGLKPRAESTSPLKGAARGHHPAQRAEADSPPRGAVRQPAEAGSENDPGGFRPARSPTPWGPRERGREDDDAAAARRTDPRRPICAVPFAAPPRCGTRRGASPLQGGRIFQAATPDPPARLGRNRRRERVPTVACAIPAGMVAGTVVAAPVARRARQRLAPTPACGAAVRCRGQAVPDPPARRAGNPVVRRWAWWWVGRRGGRCMPRGLPRLEARRARQRLAPTRWAGTGGPHARGWR
jgi:hypothetical protein